MRAWLAGGAALAAGALGASLYTARTARKAEEAVPVDRAVNGYSTLDRPATRLTSNQANPNDPATYPAIEKLLRESPSEPWAPSPPGSE